MNNNKLKKTTLLIAVFVFIVTSCSQKTAVKSIETDEILISVSFADDSFFEKYRTYEQYDQYDINIEYAHKLKIAFIPNVPVKDFSWLSLGFKYDDDWDFVRDDDGRLVYVVEEELYRLEELHPQKPLVVSWVDAGGMMPSVFGYSYRDKDGQKKYFAGQAGNYGGDPEEYDGPDVIFWQFFPMETDAGNYRGEPQNAPAKIVGGTYSFGDDDNAPSGSLMVYPLNEHSALFFLSLSRGAPSYNTGELCDKMTVKDNAVIYDVKDEYSNCKLTFEFSSGNVKITTDEERNECGFGFGVEADNTYKLINKAIPEYYINMQDDTIWFKDLKFNNK